MDVVEDEGDILDDDNIKPQFIVYDAKSESNGKPMIGFIFKTSSREQYVYEIELENLEDISMLTAESLTKTIYSQHKFLDKNQNDEMTRHLKEASGKILQAIEGKKKSQKDNINEGSVNKIPNSSIPKH